MKQNQESWYHLKASVADAFAATQNSYLSNSPLKEGEVDNLTTCLVALNEYMDKDFPEDTNEEDVEVTNSCIRLGGIVRLWLSMNDPSQAVERLEGWCKYADEETQETLHDLATMIKQFQKEI